MDDMKKREFLQDLLELFRKHGVSGILSDCLSCGSAEMEVAYDNWVDSFTIYSLDKSIIEDELEETE